MPYRSLRLVLPTALCLFGVVAGCDPSAPATDAGSDAPSPVDAGGCSVAGDCDDGRFCNGAERCTEGACTAGTAPCAAADCDESADTCDADCATPDADGDGVDAITCGGTDCDDTDRNRTPGNTEICDAVDRDEDCDPTTFGVRDLDGDTWPDLACCNGTVCGTDCDDSRNNVHPGQLDICNVVDDDCDGRLDEGATTGGWHADCDNDDHGRSDGAGVLACEAPPDPPSVCGGGGEWALDDDDCDDTSSSRYTGAIEVCDGIDNDCNDLLDGPGEDDDGDTYADACAGAAGTDCNDTCPTCHPGAPALTGACDGLDHDCDGSVDEGMLPVWYRDVDGDGVGVASMPTSACSRPSGYAATAGDCNDGDTYTGVCSAPLRCIRGIACACEVSLLHGRDLFDIDTGDVRMTGVPGSAYDITVEFGSEVGSPPVPWTVRIGTGRQIQHLPFTLFSRVDASYATGLAAAPINQYFTPDRVILVRTTSGLYKLGHPARYTPPGDPYEHVRFLYAPIGAPPAGFACAAPR